MAAATPSNLTVIMEKIVCKDKDFRYMAISDLQGELQLDSFKIEDPMERKLCTIILESLEDPSGDISALAVKCLALLVQRVHLPNATFVLSTLATRLISGKDGQREMISIALKTLIAEVKATCAMALFVQTVTPELLKGLQIEELGSILTASLEILVETVAKFGEQFKDDIKVSVRDALLPLLSDSRTGLRKKAMQGLAGLAIHCSDEQLSIIYSYVFSGLQDPGVKKDVRSVYIQTLGAISKSVGWKFGPQLPTAIPIVVQYCIAAGEADDELRENCMQALEAFITKCPSAAKPFLEPVLALVLNGIQHDPNLADDMSDDGSGDEEDDDLSEDYSDDEDLSWKVRRGSAKCLSAIVTSYPELLCSIYPRASPLLLQRFKEREENVKSDIFATVCDLMRSIAIAARRFPGDETGMQPLIMLRADAEHIVVAAARQLRDKSLKTKTGVFSVLKELVVVLTAEKWITPDLVKQLLPGICTALQDTSSSSATLKIPALQFMRMSMEHSVPEVWQPFLPSVAPLLQAAVAERYYKVTAEALRTVEQAIVVLRPDACLPILPQLQGLVQPLFTAAASRVHAQDQDQEVKECAMLASCKAVAVLGDALVDEVPLFLQVVLERIRNEITRLVAVKGLTLLLESPLDLHIQPVIGPAMEQLTSFLRKYHRPLRYSALNAIQAIVSFHSSLVADDALKQAIVEVAPLVNEKDLMLATLGLNFCRILLQTKPAAANFIASTIVRPAVELSSSAVIQGTALEAVQALFISLMKTGISDASYQVLHHKLLEQGNSADISKAGQLSVASCIAAICNAAGSQQVSDTVRQLLHWVQTGSQGEVGLRLSLLTLGEIGRVTDLSGYPDAQSALTSALSSPSEEVKAAASTALGAVTFGNVGMYLPFLLNKIMQQTADKYLLLKALNEAIIQLAHSKDGSARLDATHQQQVVHLLLEDLNGEAEEQPSNQDTQCRNAGAECLGHLALLHPPLLTVLQGHAQSPNATMRTYVVKAVKATLVPGPHSVDPLLVSVLPLFLGYIRDDSRHVRKAVVELLNAAAHNKPGLVVDHLRGALPCLYAQTVIDQSLIRIVDLGPFKHEIDDGLELRKVAFECMDVVFESCPDNIDYNDFLAPLQSGLSDHYDIRMGCHLLLCKLSGRAGALVLTHLERLVPRLEATLSHKVKPDAVKQETDRNEDMVRSCLRAIDSLQAIPNSEACAPFRTLMTNIVMKAHASKFEAVQRERAEIEGKESWA